MLIIIMMLLSLMIHIPHTSAQDCATVNGIRIPCATVETSTNPETTKEVSEPPPIDVTAFLKGELARDATPEHLTALNDPTWENIRHAAVARLYRNYKIMLTTQMIDAVTKALVQDVKTRKGFTDADYMAILETIAAEHGLPIYNHAELGLTSSPVSEKLRRAMQQLSLGDR